MYYINAIELCGNAYCDIMCASEMTYWHSISSATTRC